MVVPVQNYAALTPQGNPGARGMLPAISEGLKLGFMPFQLKEELQKQKLMNALAEIQVQYAPQMNDSELAYKQAQIPHLNAQTDQIKLNSQFYPQDIMSQINSRNSGTELNQAHLKYLPLEYALKSQNNKRVGGRFGAAYEFSRALGQLPAPTRAKWISENQEVYNDMLNTLGNKTLQKEENNNNSLVDRMLGKFFPEEFQLNPTPEQSQNMINSGIAQQGDPQNISKLSEALSNLQELPTDKRFKSSSDLNEIMSHANDIYANNSLVTASTRRQLEGAIQVSEIMNEEGFRKRAINASQYAGAIGSGKASAAALFQRNPEAYEDYLTFANSDMVFLKNRIKTLDLMGSTDKQREELDGLYNRTMDNVTSNPQQFIVQLNNLGAAIESVASGVEKSASPLGMKSRVNKYVPIAVPKTTYGKPPSENSSSSENSSPGAIKIRAPSGKIYQIPSDKVDQVLSTHPGYERMK